MLIAAVEERYKDAGELTKIIKQSRIAGMSRGMMSSTAVVKGCGFILIDPSNRLTTDLFPGAIFFSSSVPRPAFHVAVKEKERNLAGRERRTHGALRISAAFQIVRPSWGPYILGGFGKD